MFVLILVLGVFFGFLRGVKEGMVMVQPLDMMFTGDAYQPTMQGVRGHLWFYLYHRLSVLVFCIFALGYGVYLRMPFDGMELAVLMLVIWETFEVGYAFARFGKFIPARENMVWMTLVREQVQIAHAVRTIAVIVLMFYMK